MSATMTWSAVTVPSVVGRLWSVTTGRLSEPVAGRTLDADVAELAAGPRPR